MPRKEMENLHFALYHGKTVVDGESTKPSFPYTKQAVMGHGVCGPLRQKGYFGNGQRLSFQVGLEACLLLLSPCCPMSEEMKPPPGSLAVKSKSMLGEGCSTPESERARVDTTTAPVSVPTAGASTARVLEFGVEETPIPVEVSKRDSILAKYTYPFCCDAFYKSGKCESGAKPR